MLLPRHIVDIYAGWLFVAGEEEYDDMKASRCSSNTGRKAKHKRIRATMNMRGMDVSNGFGSNKDEENFHESCQIVDDQSSVVALQTLLARCSSTMKSGTVCSNDDKINKIKTRATQILMKIAVRNMEAILEVFVPAQSETGCTVGGNGFAYSMEAAAARLASALATSPDESLGMICKKVSIEAVYACEIYRLYRYSS